TVALAVGRDQPHAEYVPALVDGQAVPVPVFDATAYLDDAQARLAEHRRAIAAMPAVTTTAPAATVAPADPGLSLAVRQYVLYGSIASLAAGGAVWMLGAAVAAVAPHA